MTSQQIKRSIETGELQLSSGQKFTHYSIVFFFTLIPLVWIAMIVYNYIIGKAPFFDEILMYFMTIPIILVLLFYIIQKRKLKFTIIETTLTRDELNSIIANVAQRLEWMTFNNNKSFYIAKTYPGFLSGSWGEQITILFDKNKLLINSICDPDKISIVSMGRNRTHVTTLIEEIKNAQR